MRTFILQQKVSWTASAIIASNTGASIVENSGLVNAVIFPYPIANHLTASAVHSAV